MSSLKDCLPQDTLNALISAKKELQKIVPQRKKKKRKAVLLPIEVGNIYKIEADERNGITPPPGRKTWFKHFAVMGIADDGSVMGCVVFDSEMNREHIEPGYEDFFIPISQGTYSFIDHDSYLECLKLKPATLMNIRNGKAEGRLTEDDLKIALQLTKRSNRNSIITLRTYNIL
jgi:hypothetical protein